MSRHISDDNPPAEPADDPAVKRQEELRENLQVKADLFNQSSGHLNSLDGIDCPLCRNRGYTEEVRFTGYYYSIMVECPCMKRRKSWRRLQNSGMAESVRRLTFDTFVVESSWQDRIRRKAQQYVQEGSPGWFYIGGAVGCGKTHICTASCGELLRENLNVRYMCWPDESVKLKGNVNEAEYEGMIREFKDCDVLYVDDFFKVGRSISTTLVPTDADVKLAYQIINYRYMAKKKTIVSSEWMIDELMDFDEATASRIYEMSRGYTLQIARNRDRNHRYQSEELEERECEEEME